METLKPLDLAVADLLQDLPDAVLVLDTAGRVKWGNRTAERLFGQKWDDWIDLSALDLVHPDDLELVLRSFTSVQRKAVGSLIEVRAKTPSGWRLLEVIGTPVSWSGEAAVLFSMRDLTERRRFEVANNDEAKFRALVHYSPAVTMLLSPAGFVESASGAISQVLGHDPELVEERLLAELVCESDRAAFLTALEKARTSSDTSPEKVKVRLLRHASSETIPFELTLVNLLDDPTIAGFIVSAHDITAIARAEEEWEKTLSLLSATLDCITDGILVVDNAGRITMFNRRFAEMWQLPDSVLETRDAAMARGRVAEQLVDPELFHRRVNELYADPEAKSDDLLHFADGRVFQRHSRPQLIGEAVVGRVWSFRDVTQLSRAEEQFTASEQRFRHVFKQSPLPMAVVDVDSRVTNANHAFCRLVGQLRDDLVGKRFDSFIHRDDAEEVAALERRLLEGEIESYRTDARALTSKGDAIFVTVQASLVRGEDEQMTHGLRILEDLTERQQTERMLVNRATAAGRLHASLTSREIEVLELLAELESASQIADHLSVSVRTVESHLANSYRKLGVRTKQAATNAYAELKRALAFADAPDPVRPRQ